MTKIFAIYGAIVSDNSSRESIEDLSPAQFRSFVDGLDDGDELVIQMNSPGGDAFAGFAIANTIKQISSKVKTVCVVEGLAASIASVIMCACDKIQLHSSSMVMIHNCWGVVQGDSNELRKQAEMMDKINDAIISFYRSKFDLSEKELQKLMDEETWFSGEEAESFKLNAEIIPDEEGYRIAAKVKDFDLSKFAHTPKTLKENIMEENEKQAETVEEEKTVVEDKADETVVEDAKVEVPENENQDEEKDELTETETVIASAEAERRVRGMQSKMAMQINALKKDYEGKIQALVEEHQKQIEDFTSKLNDKCAELDKATAESLSRAETIDKLTKELQITASALAKQNDALDELTTSVLTPGASLPTMREGLARCKTAKEKSEFLASGKYRKG